MKAANKNSDKSLTSIFNKMQANINQLNATIEKAFTKIIAEKLKDR